MAALAATQPIQLSFNPLDPIGSLLEGALEKVKETLVDTANKVGDVTSDVIKLAANQAILIISNLKGAYQDSLQKTYQAAEKLTQTSINEIYSLVDDITSKNTSALLKIADRIEDIVNQSVLGRPWVPRLTRVEPQFFAVNTTSSSEQPIMTTVDVNFFGNFPYADRSDCIPTFKLNE